MNKITLIKRLRRVRRTRSKIFGTTMKPRVAVFRSNRYLYLQLIDDETGRTLASASTRELAKTKETKTEEAAILGELLAKKAIEAGIKTVVFDRRFYKYHGRVRAAAEAMRKSGLSM